MTTYELRSNTGNSLMAFDSLDRARAYQRERKAKHNINLRLFEIKRVESELQG